MKKIIKIVIIMLFMFVGINEVKAWQIYKCSNEIGYYISPSGMSGKTSTAVEYYVHYPYDDNPQPRFIQISSSYFTDSFLGKTSKIINNEVITGLTLQGSVYDCASSMQLSNHYDGSYKIMNFDKFEFHNAELVYSSDNDFWQIYKGNGNEAINVYRGLPLYVDYDKKITDGIGINLSNIISDAISNEMTAVSIPNFYNYDVIYYNNMRDSYHINQIEHPNNTFTKFLNESMLESKVGKKEEINALEKMQQEYLDTVDHAIYGIGYIAEENVKHVDTRIKMLEDMYNSPNSKYFCENVKNTIDSVNDNSIDPADNERDTSYQTTLDVKREQLDKAWKKFKEKYEKIIENFDESDDTMNLPQNCGALSSHVTTSSVEGTAIEQTFPEFVNYMNNDILQHVNTTHEIWNIVCEEVLELINGESSAITEKDMNSTLGQLEKQYESASAYIDALETNYNEAITSRTDRAYEDVANFYKTLDTLNGWINKLNEKYANECGDDWLKEQSDKSKENMKRLEDFQKGLAEDFQNIKQSTGFHGEDKTTCEDLIPQEIRDIIQDALGYVRILVPILIIVLGMIDFGKAVLSSKEDEMKKAQNKFVKRLIIGVVVFFVPTILDIMFKIINELGVSTGSCGIR